MGEPKAAPAHFPYPDHRTVAELWWGERPQVERAIEDLERINLSRSLTDAESSRLQTLIYKQAKLAA